MKHLPSTLACALALTAGGPAAAAALQLGLFIAVPDGQATYESAPALLGGQPGWVEQGIRTEQIGGDGGNNDIWTASGLGNGNNDASWYPDGGDDGYTRITRTLGQDFGSIGFFAGIGWLDEVGPSLIAYELLNDGVSVLSGSLAAVFTGGSFGFTGGDFDEVRMRAYRGPLPTFDTCVPVQGISCNSFWVADVRYTEATMTVPAPPAAALAALGLALLGWQRRGRPAGPTPV